MNTDFRQCTQHDCQLRFPAAAAELLDDSCPRCSGPTRKVSWSNSTLQDIQTFPEVSGISLAVVLDNLRSAYNVGSIVRTADGAGISHLYLCGITPTLDHPKIAKTALGAEATVESSYHPNALTLVSDLKSEGIYLVALESRPGAVSLFDPALRIPTTPAVLVVGNELIGVDPAVIELCDLVVDLPMMGTKRSLNVVVAFGIASYLLRFGMNHICA